MNYFYKNFLERWYNLILLIGLGLFFVAFSYPIKYLNPKHLIGLSIGLILIGLAFNIARKHISIFRFGGMFQTEGIFHNFLSYIILFFGVLITIVFLTFILIALV